MCFKGSLQQWSVSDLGREQGLRRRRCTLSLKKPPTLLDKHGVILKVRSLLQDPLRPAAQETKVRAELFQETLGKTAVWSHAQSELILMRGLHHVGSCLGNNVLKNLLG